MPITTPRVLALSSVLNIRSEITLPSCEQRIHTSEPPRRGAARGARVSNMDDTTPVLRPYDELQTTTYIT